MKSKSKSIRTRLIAPLLAVMLIQALLFLGLVLFGGISRDLKVYAMNILKENTENNKLYMEKELIYRWMNVINNTEELTLEIEAVLKEEQKSPEDLKLDSVLSQKVVEAVSPRLIGMLRRTYGTGVFVILDAPAAKNAEEAKAGVYIRDLDPKNYTADNSDLLLERGSSWLSKSLGIPLDRFWEMGFLLQDEEASAFFYGPYHLAAAKEAKYEEASKYGYLCPPYTLSENDIPVISYSVPLILRDGSVIGVVGVEMTLSHIQTMMDYEELDNGGNGICFLGIQKTGSDTIRKVAVTGGAYDAYFQNRDSLDVKPGEEGICQVAAANGKEWYMASSKLGIYQYHTPLQDGDWVLTGMVSKDTLLKFNGQIERMMLVSLLIAIILSMLAVLLAEKMVTVPISRLIKELRKQTDTGSLSLTRVHIDEIDELTEAIEKLSEDVAKSASRISGILDHANVAIGVYEYYDEDTPVFISRTLFEMLGWEEISIPYAYLDAAEFDKRMSQAKRCLYDEKNHIYEMEEPEKRWLKIITVSQDTAGVLGVVTDVTGEILERIKLERERNYDLLTNLYNRRAFKEKATQALKLSKESTAAMIMWDLDNLKYINDTYGHDEGDKYIVLFARNLKRFEVGNNLTSRYSGDEFVTLLFSPSGKDEIRKEIHEFMVSLQSATMTMPGGYKIPLRVSAGISWFPEDTQDFEQLVSYADFAMYTVKHSVKGMVMEFDQKQYSDNSYLLAGREEMNRLFEQNEIDFAFQPIVARSGEIYGYELLMRPKLKRLRDISELLNLARAQAKLSQMEVLTWKAGLKKAAKQIQEGHIKAGEKLFINSIASVILPEHEVLELEQLYAPYLSQIVMEMTESEPVNSECLTEKIRLVKSWDALIAIDDFGSGYNSETIFLDIEPDIVKLDMTLVRNIHIDKNRQFMVNNILQITRRNGSIVLAEGVETEEELKVLLDMGIDLFQGYYLARPELEVRPVSPYVLQKLKQLSSESL